MESGRFSAHECCDCSLTHKVEYRLIDGKLYERWTRDPVETRKRRRKSNKARVSNRSAVKKRKGR